MPRNSYFQFKQFTVQQDRCATKFCTDACVFGAWAGTLSAKRILDIGTGTGLLSLMAAQRNKGAQIDTVQIDTEAAEQAHQNIKASPFAERIHVFQTPVQDFNPPYTYDTILINPPFFQADLRSPDARINQAHHAGSLTFSEILSAIARFLEARGIGMELFAHITLTFSGFGEPSGIFTSGSKVLYKIYDRSCKTQKDIYRYQPT